MFGRGGLAGAAALGVDIDSGDVGGEDVEAEGEEGSEATLSAVLDVESGEAVVAEEEAAVLVDVNVVMDAVSAAAAVWVWGAAIGGNR